jgi:hypothetical protein
MLGPRGRLGDQRLDRALGSDPPTQGEPDQHAIARALIGPAPEALLARSPRAFKGNPAGHGDGGIRIPRGLSAA